MTGSSFKFPRSQATEFVPLRLPANRAGGARCCIRVLSALPGGRGCGGGPFGFYVHEKGDSAIARRVGRKAHLGGQFGASARRDRVHVCVPRCCIAGRDYRGGGGLCLERASAVQGLVARVGSVRP